MQTMSSSLDPCNFSKPRVLFRSHFDNWTVALLVFIGIFP